MSKRVRSLSFDAPFSQGSSSTMGSTMVRSTRRPISKNKKRFTYASLYRNISNRIYQFVDRAEFLIGLAAGGTGAYGPWSAAPGNFATAPAGGGSNNGFSIYTSLEQVVFSSSAGLTVPYDFENYTSYTNLFEEYRIDEVVFEMKYNSNSFPTSTTVAVPGAPIIYLAVDYDDFVVPTTNELLQYASAKCIQFGNSSGTNNGNQWYKHVPAVNIVSNTSTGTEISVIKKHQWIDTEAPNAIHYGVKGWYDNPYWNIPTAGATIQGYITMTVKIKFSCRNTK